MLSLLKKELRLFFGSTTGPFVIGSFLTINGLLLWVLKSNFNILDSGFADLNLFFISTPWLFLLLIPALTMRSFSDEFNSGTIEILKTKPLSNLELIGGKFLSILILITIALIPTFLYVYSIYWLANPVGNIDLGSLMGSYLGLFFIASAFSAIGLWVSSYSKNQLVVLITGIAFSFFCFYGFQNISEFFPKNAYTIQQWGMQKHYLSIGRGVLDTRDLLYFISVSILFLTLTYVKISTHKKQKYYLYTIGIILFINSIGNYYYKRFDLTDDKRYTLSQTSINILNTIENQMVIRVYLEGDFPVEFKRLQAETKQLLEELRNENKRIKILFINPKDNLQKHLKNGLTPSRLTVKEDGVISETIILPWATIHYQNKKELVSLLKDSKYAESQEEQLENSIQNLEYAFVDGLKKVSSPKEKSIAILKGNGELDDIYLYSFLKTIGKYYHLAPFTLDSVRTHPKKTFELLKTYDLAILAKPTEFFTEKEKYLLDQYTLNGGNSIWMLDYVHAEMDSLLQSGKTLAYPRNLNLEDFFFRYGLRINPNLVKDLYASKIALATGNTGNKTNFQKFDWLYHPLINSNNTHPISDNIDAVRLQFASSIDTLKNSLKKTVLLESSPFSKSIATPHIIELKSVAEQVHPKMYDQGKKHFGILLEGKFTSAYKDRVKPFKLSNAKESGTNAKMIVIADGDIATNQIHQGKPLDLNIDKWTKQFYGNKAFLSNAIDYLLDDTDLMSIRSKNIDLNSLNKNKIQNDKLFWQILNTCLPLFVLAVFCFLFNHLRKQKYGSISN